MIDEEADRHGTLRAKKRKFRRPLYCFRTHYEWKCGSAESDSSSRRGFCFTSLSVQVVVTILAGACTRKSASCSPSSEANDHASVTCTLPPPSNNCGLECTRAIVRVVCSSTDRYHSPRNRSPLLKRRPQTTRYNRCSNSAATWRAHDVPCRGC